MTQSHYIGDELELFAQASNWKRYWSSRIGPLLGRRVLDVGAGIGATARVFANRGFDQYLALEPDPALAARIQAASATGELPGSLTTRIGTISDLDPVPSFDSILYIDVLEHIADDKGELERARSLLLPGGRIIVLAPAHQWLYSPFDAAVGHVRRYSRATLLEAKPAALGCESLYYLDSVGMLASAANRWVFRAPLPTARQIRLWDLALVPASGWVDRLTAGHAGKTVIGVFRAPLA